MIGSRRYDHVFRFDEPGRRLNDQTRRSHLPPKAGGGYSAAHRRTNDGRLLLQKACDVVAGRERMGVVGLKGESSCPSTPSQYLQEVVCGGTLGQQLARINRAELEGKIDEPLDH